MTVRLVPAGGVHPPGEVVVVGPPLDGVAAQIYVNDFSCFKFEFLNLNVQGKHLCDDSSMQVRPSSGHLMYYVQQFEI